MLVLVTIIHTIIDSIKPEITSIMMCCFIKTVDNITNIDRIVIAIFNILLIFSFLMLYMNKNDIKQ